MAAKPETSVSLLFVLVVVIGSGNFVAVSFSNAELAPFWGAGLRFSLSAILFVVVALALRLPWPRGRALLLTANYGVFTFALSYALMYWALTQMSAGMAAIVLATVPLTTPLLAAAHRLEPIDRRGLLGAVVALGAIVWMTLESGGVAIPVGGVVATLVASISIGEAVVISKRISANHPAMNNAVGMLAGAPLLLLTSLVAGETWVIPREPSTIAAVAYLVVVGSLALFVLTLLVVRRWTAAATSYMFVLFPVGAILLDAWLLDVALTPRAVIGAVIVMAAAWFGVLAPRRTAPPSRASG